MSAPPAARSPLPILLAAVVFVLGLLVATRVYHQYDVVDVFSRGRALCGLRPWTCNAGRGRRQPRHPRSSRTCWRSGGGASRRPRSAPRDPAFGSCPVAHALAVPALHGLARPWARPGQRQAAIPGAVCPAFFVKARLGQFEASVDALPDGVVALLLDRPVARGGKFWPRHLLLAIVRCRSWRFDLAPRSADAGAQRPGGPWCRCCALPSRRPWGRHAEGLHPAVNYYPFEPPKPTTPGISSTATMCSCAE